MIDHGKLIVYDTISNLSAKVSGGGNVVEVGLQRPIDKGLVTKKIASITGVVTADLKDDKTLRIKFSGGLDVQERLLSNLVEMNIGVISYKPASSELEEAYLKLITATL